MNTKESDNKLGGSVAEGVKTLEKWVRRLREEKKNSGKKVDQWMVRVIDELMPKFKREEELAAKVLAQATEKPETAQGLAGTTRDLAEGAELKAEEAEELAGGIDGGEKKESEEDQRRAEAEAEGDRLAYEHEKNRSDAAERGEDNIQYWGTEAKAKGESLAYEHEKNRSDAAERSTDVEDNIQYWGTEAAPSVDQAVADLNGPSEGKEEEGQEAADEDAWLSAEDRPGLPDDDTEEGFYDEKNHPGNRGEQKLEAPKEAEQTQEGKGQGKKKREKRGGADGQGVEKKKPENKTERARTGTSQWEGLTGEERAQIERLKEMGENMSPEERARITKELEHDLESRALEYADAFPRSGEGEEAKYNMARLILDAWNRNDRVDNFEKMEQMKKALVYAEKAKEIQEKRVEKQREMLALAFTEYFSPEGKSPVSLAETRSISRDRVSEVMDTYGKYMEGEKEWEVTADIARRIIDGWNVSQGKDWFEDKEMVKTALMQARKAVNSLY